MKKLIIAIAILASLICAVKVSSLFDKLEEDLGASIAEAETITLVDGKNINIDYTDDNTDEKLIIKAQDSDIMSFAGSTIVLFSVYNSSKNDQNVKIAFSFANDYEQHIYEQNGEKVEEVLIFPALKETATTSARNAVYDTVTSTIWSELSTDDFTAKLTTRKDIKETQTLKETSTFIKSGETKFLKAVIKYIPTGREEFFIEAFGDYDYGHLDPWAYEQDFNSLTTGDLNGQDSWSGDTDYDVQTSETYEGAKAVKDTPSSGWDSINRNITSLNAGSVYFAMMKTESLADSYVVFREGITNKMNIIMYTGGTSVDIYENGGARYSLGTLTNGEWGVVNMEFDDVAHPDVYRARLHDGSSWGAWSDWYTVNTGSYTNITNILFQAYPRGGGGSIYIDTFTATDPTPPAPSAAPPSQESDIIFFQ